MSDPVITVGISPSAVQGVAIAAYSGRLSRMWAWDAKCLQVLGHQDIRARVYLRDVTDSVNYCAYYAEAHSKKEHYVAISRPPYFHALWLRNTFHLGGSAVLFRNPQIVRFCLTPKTEEKPWSRIIEERLLDDSPFRFESMEWEGHQAECDRSSGRCSGVHEYTDHWHWQTRALPHWVGTDPVGRKITVRGAEIFADDVPFLDCSRMPFEPVVPPSWAKIWDSTG